MESGVLSREIFVGFGDEVWGGDVIGWWRRERV